MHGWRLPIIIALIFIGLSLFHCHLSEDELPVLSKSPIPSFSFLNQDSIRVSEQSFADKLYVADFFFISCPTICPLMTTQMKRIHDHFLKDDRLLLLSHSIDTKYDTVGRLKEYADNLGVTSDKWHFVTGQRENIFSIAEAYFNIVVEDESVPGGYDHTGRFVLIDKNRQVRAFCQGTIEQEVDKFIKNIEKLLDEAY